MVFPHLFLFFQMTSNRQNVFHALQEELLFAVSAGAGVQECLNSAAEKLEFFSIPNITDCLVTNHNEDTYAQTFMPKDAPPNLVPLVCTPNGNCFFNAVSILLTGNELLSTELRVRCGIALLQLKDQFINFEGTAVHQLIKEQIVLYSPFGRTDLVVHQNISSAQVVTVFQSEVINTLTDKCWSGMWQIIGLATALQVPIFSVYPDYNAQIRSIFNTKVEPIIGSTSDEDTIYILWSGNVVQDQFQPNHFVPLVKKTSIKHRGNSGASKTIPLKRTAHDSKNLPDVKKSKSQGFCMHQTPSSSTNVQPSCGPENPNAYLPLPFDTSICVNDEPNTQALLTDTSDVVCHQKSNPMPWSKPFSVSGNADFLKKITFSHEYCGSCLQRILAKQKHKYGDLGAVCSYCYRFLNKSETPPVHHSLLYPGDVPDVLLRLNSTERKLISQVHPYMTMLVLPAGGQHGLKGQSINIPAPMQEICSTLPRNMASPLVKVYSAKSQHHCEIVNTQHIDAALQWLKVHNVLYKDIIISESTLLQNQPVSDASIASHSSFSNDISAESPSQYSNTEVETQDIGFIPIDHQVQADAKIDYPIAKLPIISNPPLNIFTDINIEELAFPMLYPYGTNGFHHPRPQQPTAFQYFRCRFLNKDQRWSSSPQYLFWALHIYEQEKLQSAISVALRHKTQANSSLQVQDVTNAHSITLKTDNYMFMKQLRGTAAYWKNELSKLIAKIRTLGAPTFFMSLSANDMHWFDNFKFINPGLSDDDIAQLSYTERCKLIRQNPVLSALHFKARWEAFLHSYLLVKPYPLGHVTDFFARVEFQARGSPHMHIFLWVADAPSFDCPGDKDLLLPFIDKYISAELPAKNTEEYKLVNALQTHTHTSTCRKKGRVTCRFDFPMPISDQTRFRLAADLGSRSRFYILRRKPEDLWINPYNLNILKNWNANMDIQMVGTTHGVARYVCSYICKNEPLAFRQEVATVLKKMPNDASQRKILSNIGNILLTHRTIGSQETAYRLLGLEMVYSSRETVFINTSLPNERFRVLKTKKKLEELPKASTDVFADGLPQYYTMRPSTPPFPNMSLSEFVTNYKLNSYTPKNPSTAQPRYTLNANGESKCIVLRTKAACLRCSIPHVLANSEAHYFSLLYLFLPFRSETEILHPFSTYQESFIHKKDRLDQKQLHHTSLMNEFEKSLKHLLAMEVQDIHDIQALTTPSCNLAKDMTEAEESTCYNNIFAYDILPNPERDNSESSHKNFSVELFHSMAGCTMTEEEFLEKRSLLSDSQKGVFQVITEAEQTPMHIFITGGAGTGKSFLLKLIREHFLRTNCHTLPNTLVAAPTGVAAYNIGGLTLHSLLQLPTQDCSNAPYRPLSPRSFKILSEAFKYVKYLIIDEVSMVSYNTLEHVHLRLNEIKGSLLGTDKMFGDITIIAFGDLYQLRPVFGSPVYANTNRNTVLHLWKDLFKLYELKENQRQSVDTTYAKLLNRIRIGEHTNKDLVTLQNRLIKSSTKTSNLLHIFPLKKDRDAHNAKYVSELTTEKHTFSAIHDVAEKFIPTDDQKCAGIPHKLTLAVNTRVMLIRNIDTQHGLVNGAQGTIQSFEWLNPQGKSVEEEMPAAVNVLFDDYSSPAYSHSTKLPITIKPITVKFLGKEQTYVSRTQIPLVLSFATTVHKVQGLTVAKAVIDLGPSVFASGMAYVALSRVPSLSSVHLLRLCPTKISASKAVQEEMNRMREIKK